MTYSLLRFAHLVGLMLIGAGLIGVWMSDLRSRKVRDLVLFAEAVRNIAVFYDGVVVPGAVILFVSGTWMIVEVWGGWGFMQHPWLASRLLTKSASGVFATLRGSTYGREYASPLRLLRPCWTAFLNSLRGIQVPSVVVDAAPFLRSLYRLSTTC